MSYNCYKMLADIQTQQKLKRSRIQSELNYDKNKSPVRKLLEKKDQQDKELKNQIQKVADYIKSQNDRILERNSNNLKILIVDSEIERCQRQSALRRSRLQSQIRNDKIMRNIEKSRLQAQILGNRLFAARSIQDGIRKFKVQSNVQYLLKKY